MTTEIELKYFISASETPALAQQITTWLTAHHLDFQYHENKLSNEYFDTKNFDLRKMDIGLRIRACNGKYEQTIKTAGKVESGLHQRSEYNIDLTSNALALALFPTHIWPENYNIDALQAQLQVLFSTHFTRQAWLIKQANSVVELALDKGEISTPLSHQTSKIHELEIELISGEQQALFSLAEQLKTLVNIEPGNLSKAARGYALYYEAIK